MRIKSQLSCAWGWKEFLGSLKYTISTNGKGNGYDVFICDSSKDKKLSVFSRMNLINSPLTW